MPWFGYSSELVMSGGCFSGGSFCHGSAISLSLLCLVEVLVGQVFAMVWLFL